MKDNSYSHNVKYRRVNRPLLRKDRVDSPGSVCKTKTMARKLGILLSTAAVLFITAMPWTPAARPDHSQLRAYAHRAAASVSPQRGSAFDSHAASTPAPLPPVTFVFLIDPVGTRPPVASTASGPCSPRAPPAVS